MIFRQPELTSGSHHPYILLWLYTYLLAALRLRSVTGRLSSEVETRMTEDVYIYFGQF